jgi:hypothetical protein
MQERGTEGGLAGVGRCFDTFQLDVLAQSGEERDPFPQEDRQDVQLDLLDKSEFEALCRDAASRAG